MELLPLFIVVWVVCGIAASLIGPRKGMEPGEAFLMGLVFGIFGIAYVATRPDAAAGQRTSNYSASGTSSPPGSYRPAPVPMTKADRIVELERQRESQVIDETDYRKRLAALNASPALVPSRAPQWPD